MVLAGDLVPAGTALVTPVADVVEIKLTEYKTIGLKNVLFNTILHLISGNR